MAQIKDTPELIVKYTMRSLLPGMGSIRGLWTKVYFNKINVKTDRGWTTRTILSDKPMKRDKALQYIESHGFIKLAFDKDTILYGSPDESFRDYVIQNRIRVPDDIGASTFVENTTI